MQSPADETLPISEEHDVGETTKIRSQFTTCIDLYRSLLRLLGSTNCRKAILDHVSVERVLEEYGRLKIWGQQNRVTDPNGALDYLLRQDTDRRSGILEVLCQLDRLIGLAIPMCRKANDDAPEGDLGQDYVSSISSSSDYSTDSRSDDEDLPPLKTTKIEVLLSHVFEQIRSLYHLEGLFRRPGLTGRYLRSSKRTATSFSETHGLYHIKEKLRQWNKPLGPTDTDQPGQERETTEEDIRSRQVEVQVDTSSNFLSHRLARANAQRREQFRYWKRHPYEAPPFQPTEFVPIATPYTNVEVPEDTVSTIKGSKYGDSKSIKSTPTARSFSTVARSAIFENECTSRPLMIYAETVLGNKSSSRIPPLPECPDDHFECPYCHMSLSSAEMRKRMTWKRHVFRDLRPYTCTFHDCSNPEKLYATRHDWMYHEMQMHRRVWTCAECNATFMTKKSMAKHLKASHPGDWTPSQLPILIDMRECPADESNIISCPLCPSQISLGRLLAHLAGHMEDIALFALPSTINESDDNHEEPGSAKAVYSKLSENDIWTASGEDSPAGPENDLNTGYQGSTLSPSEPEAQTRPQTGDSAGSDTNVESTSKESTVFPRRAMHKIDALFLSQRELSNYLQTLFPTNFSLRQRKGRFVLYTPRKLKPVRWPPLYGRIQR
ncbi:hypothetical protein F5Y15DRAFT_368606 [Xylariaceae sp. FL0016]|nr:hypothetical protein F5Y15DRAFT_368606 [Xylariaceae sp. FL0016]